MALKLNTRVVTDQGTGILTRLPSDAFPLVTVQLDQRYGHTMMLVNLKPSEVKPETFRHFCFGRPGKFGQNPRAIFWFVLVVSGIFGWGGTLGGGEILWPVAALIPTSLMVFTWLQFKLIVR